MGAFFDRVGEWTGQDWPIAYRRAEKDRVRLLREFGVRTFTALNYAHKPDMAAWLNDWGADFAARTPDCLHSATFYSGPGAGDYVAAAVERGARVFKAHLQVGAYDPRDDLLDEVWGTLAEARVPVVVHCGNGPHPASTPAPARCARCWRAIPSCG